LLTDEEARELCRRVLEATTPDEFCAALKELRTALLDHTEDETLEAILRSRHLKKPTPDA
jgi:hypothetical protein